MREGSSSEKHIAACRHGVEAGNYCAKCGREIVTGPVVTDERKRDVLRALAGIVAGPLGRSAP